MFWLKFVTISMVGMWQSTLIKIQKNQPDLFRGVQPLNRLWQQVLPLLPKIIRATQQFIFIGDSCLSKCLTLRMANVNKVGLVLSYQDCQVVGPNHRSVIGGKYFLRLCRMSTNPGLNLIKLLGAYLGAQLSQVDGARRLNKRLKVSLTPGFSY